MPNIDIITCSMHCCMAGHENQKYENDDDDDDDDDDDNDDENETETGSQNMFGEIMGKYWDFCKIIIYKSAIFVRFLCLSCQIKNRIGFLIFLWFQRAQDNENLSSGSKVIKKT